MCMYCTCAHTHMHPSHYSVLTMHRVLLQRKSTGKSAWKDHEFLICRRRGSNVLGKQERSVTTHEACASYKMFLFLFCYWEGNKMGEGRGSVWRKDVSYRCIVIARFWVSRLWSLHGALLAEKMETPKINSIFIQLIKSSFGRNRHPPF